MDKLTELALKFGSDKAGHHNYTPYYYENLKGLKDSPLSLLEIGVGGYSYPDRGGAGLLMWQSFFLNGNVVGIDIYDKTLDVGRAKIYKGSQTDSDFLRDLVLKEGPFDVIVDDGSHINSHVIAAFETLFPTLKGQGFYFVEDCHTSYWSAIATDGTDFEGGDHPRTTMNYFKALADNVNSEDSGKPDLQIDYITFYKQMILIRKK